MVGHRPAGMQCTGQPVPRSDAVVWDVVRMPEELAFPSQNRLPAFTRAAGAGIQLLGRRGVRLIQDVVVVVHQLLASLDLANRVYEYAILLDHGFTVRVAGMIDESRRIPAHRRVHDHAIVQVEEKRMVMFARPGERIAAIRLLAGDPFSLLFDDSLAFTNPARREGAASLNRRFPHFIRKAPPHTDCGPFALHNPFDWYLHERRAIV